MIAPNTELLALVTRANLILQGEISPTLKIKKGDYDKLCWLLTHEIPETIRRTAAFHEAESARLREALTPCANTKAAYIGVFRFTINDLDEYGEAYTREVTVPWTVIKQIMSTIKQRAALATPETN